MINIHNISPVHWPIRIQILLVLLVCLSTINYVGGQVARQYEESELQELLQQQHYRNYWLMHAAVIESVTSEDIPLLESFSSQVTESDSNIIFLEIRNEEGTRLVHSEKRNGDEYDKIMSFSEPFIVEGETFGSMMVTWDIQSIYDEVDEHGTRMQMSITISLVSLTLMILALLQWVLIKPVRQIHQRLNNISGGDFKGSLSISASSELMHLADSVNQLSNVLITRKRFERELVITQLTLEKLSKQNELILNSAGEGIYGLDKEGRATFVNTAAAKMIGWEVEDLLGKDLCEILHYSEKDGYIYSKEEHPVHSVCNDGVARRVEDEVFRRKNGSNFPVEYICTPIIENEKPTGAVVIFKDVSEKINAVKDLSKAVSQARKANKVKSEFLAVMSHEIRTPLNAIIGASNLLLDTPLEEEQKIYASTVAMSGKTLLTLINDILDYSKLEAGKMTLEKEDFNIIGLSNEICGLFATEASKKDIVLEVVASPDIPDTVGGDSGRLRQVLLNLVGNAIKYTESGSIKVHIKYQGEVDGRLLLSIKVQDTGIGIPLKMQSTLFDEFSQVDASFTRKYGGTGLGLAITRNIVSLMDGNIQCESEVGIGSVFTVNIKLWKSGNSADVFDAENKVPDMLKKSNQDEDVSSTGGRILLVEDSMANQVIATAYLKKAGYTVDAVADGSEAITAVKTRHYDLVLMDLAMPFMDGFEATKRIRKLAGDMSYVPIIAMTANTMQGDRESCLLAGMNDYLPKPVNRSYMLSKIKSWLSPANGEINSVTDKKRHQDDDSLIDHGVLKQLEKDTSSDVAPDIINVFLRETDKRLKLIKEACEKVDYSVLQKEAHVLKSSAGTYGALELQQLAIKVDIACKEKRGRDAIEMALKLVQTGFRSLTLLSEYIGHTAKPNTTV